MFGEENGSHCGECPCRECQTIPADTELSFCLTPEVRVSSVETVCEEPCELCFAGYGCDGCSCHIVIRRKVKYRITVEYGAKAQVDCSASRIYPGIDACPPKI